MAVLSTKVILQCNIQKAWDIVTSVEKYTWRSDLSKTERLNERQFIEYTKDGYATTFTITNAITCKRWEFDMENGNMTGHWSGEFIEEGKQVGLNITEEVNAKKFFMKPFVKFYLKKQQTLFIDDLKKALLQE